MMMRDLYKRIKDDLIQSGIESAALDARILIGHVLDLSHEEFILQQDRKLSREEIEKIRHIIAQRIQRKPVAKIIGQKEFYGRMFLTNEHTLDPRPDSEILIDSVLQRAPKINPLDILDMGTGTGCLLLTLLAEMVDMPRAIGTAVDVSMRALAVAQENATRWGVHDRVVFVQSDWFDKVTGRFDVIISNPPYIPSADIDALADDVKRYDPLSALDGGTDGLEPYRILAARASSFLVPGGLIAFEVGINQAADVTEILRKQSFHSPEIVNDLGGVARVVLAKRG